MFDAVPCFDFYLNFNFCSDRHLLNSLVAKNFTHDPSVPKRDFDPSNIFKLKILAPVPVVQGSFYECLNHT